MSASLRLLEAAQETKRHGARCYAGLLPVHEPIDLNFHQAVNRWVIDRS